METKGHRFILGLVVIMAMMSACDNKVTEVSGIYKMSHAEGDEDLILSPDGTYKQSYKAKTKEEVQVHSGQWYVQKKAGYLRVYIVNWKCYSDPYKDVSSNHEGEEFGTTSLIYSNDEIPIYPDLADYSYRRVIPE